VVFRADIIWFFLLVFWGVVLFRSRFVIEPMIFYSLYRVGMFPMVYAIALWILCGILLVHYIKKSTKKY
jgi:hypothetical protein